MTLKNNRASLLCCFKLYASFRSHRLIQAGVSPETPNLGRIRRFLEPCDLEIWRMTLNKANLRDLIAATGLVILLKFDPNHRFFVPCDLEIWWMALENNRAPLLYYIKLCASFQIHRWIQIGITVRKRSIWVKIGNFLSRVTLKFDRWHRKTIEHLFYVASSFVYHFTAISEFRLELQSGNAQFWSKSMIFLAVWPRKFNGWPSKTIGHLFYATSTFVHHFIPIGSVAVNYRYRRYKSI